MYIYIVQTFAQFCGEIARNFLKIYINNIPSLYSHLNYILYTLCWIALFSTGNIFMYMCVCMCVCVYICINMHIYTHIHIKIKGDTLKCQKYQIRRKIVPLDVCKYIDKITSKSSHMDHPLCIPTLIIAKIIVTFNNL